MIFLFILVIIISLGSIAQTFWSRPSVIIFRCRGFLAQVAVGYIPALLHVGSTRLGRAITGDDASMVPATSPATHDVQSVLILM